MMNEETKIQRQIQVGCSDLAVLFRTETGMFFQGKVNRNANGSITITHAKPIKILVKGFSDLAGWRKSDGKFVGIEVKTTKGRATKEQKNFIKQVRKAGGLAGVARSVAEARDIIKGDKDE